MRFSRSSQIKRPQLLKTLLLPQMKKNQNMEQKLRQQLANDITSQCQEESTLVQIITAIMRKADISVANKVSESFLDQFLATSMTNI